MTRKLKLKVCGMREENNLSSLVEIEPDFIGFIFHEKSPRNVVKFPKTSIPIHIKKVGVFVNKSEEFILEKVKKHQLDFVQLHGQETPEYCESIKNNSIKVIKAFSIYNKLDISNLKNYKKCDFLLFDTKGEQAGGNGFKFDWSLLKDYSLDTPFLLSGGIDLEDVTAIKKLNLPQLAGIDINSKFEIEPGLKNIEKIKQFKTQLDE